MFPTCNVHSGVRLLLLCLMLSAFNLGTSLHAQTNVFDDVPALFESVFSELDDQYLSTGMLADRAYPVFAFHTRLGELPYHDSLATSSESFPYAMAMIKHMSTDHTSQDAWLTNKFFDRYENVASTDTLHVGVIAMRFDRIIDSAEHLGLISADTTTKRIYDVLPRPLSPYRIDTALIFSSLSAKLRNQSVVVSLNLDDLMTNLDSINRIEIDLGGGFVHLKPGIPLNYSFPSADTFGISILGSTFTDCQNGVVRSYIPSGLRLHPTQAG